MTSEPEAANHLTRLAKENARHNRPHHADDIQKVEKRTARASKDAGKAVLAAVPGRAPLSGDEILVHSLPIQCLLGFLLNSIIRIKWAARAGNVFDGV